MVVDDSALIRQIIVDNINETDDLEVAGVAKDGQQALTIFDDVRPDVVTLDIQMPKLDGLETLDALLARRPVPIVMVSAQTRLGADITLEALERGAIDYVAKPDAMRSAQTALREDLLRKIRAVAGTDLKRVLEIRQRRAGRKRGRREVGVAAKPTALASPSIQNEFADKCIALGISTGGPPALAALFEQLAPPLPPIVIVQHMPVHFTKQFAKRLDNGSRLSVKEAENGDTLQPNCAYVAPGGMQLELRKQGRTTKIVVREGELVSGHRPSVDVMMKSAAGIFGSRCLGIIMTGMGRDGADGCAAIRAAGGYVLGQDEETSDVYGMNKAAFTEGHVDRQFALDDAATIIAQQARRLWLTAAAMA